MSKAQALIRWAYARWDRFFFSPTDDRFGGVFRILFACVCFLNMGLLGLDLELFFSESGYMPLEAARAISHPDLFTLFSVLPATTGVLWSVYLLMMLQLLLLGLGVWPRVQAVGVFFWLCTFQHRHITLFDGEDTVFRLLAFFLIFLPLHRHTLGEWLRRRRRATGSQANGGGDEGGAGEAALSGTWPMWPFRLIQLQMCLIFVSTVLLKLSGTEWRDGTAMWYVIHLENLYGNVFNPPFLFAYMASLKAMTWGTLVLEALAPLTIWFKKTRLPTLAVLVVFHVGVDLSMNLNFFHWIMTVGWLSFLAQPINSPASDPGALEAPAS